MQTPRRTAGVRAFSRAGVIAVGDGRCAVRPVQAPAGVPFSALASGPLTWRAI